ncbi:flagellar hook-basal body complex protein FliE [Allopusillimonas ginsengisoli]|uniref:flagellar hook-basal body complex protein FliE n=1 Tax=Allopusillimonas ginsengisoli TaxID=453575 RepID=UPI0010C1E700|nr:flagellar hook-basal body complex protein FliE [Allopusillimonas ginsengisoli]
MTVQHISSVENLLAQMRAVAKAASSIAPVRSDDAPAASGGFAAELTRSLERVSSAQNGAAAQARAFQLGEPDVSLNNVMVDMQKASIAFQATIQVRNRLVAAYQEVAGMAV